MALTIRQQKYKLNRIKGMNKYNAARAAGYSESVALTADRRIERKPEVRKSLNDAFEQQGITDKKIAQLVAEGIEAEKLQSINFTIHRVPDYKARHSFIETA